MTSVISNEVTIFNENAVIDLSVTDAALAEMKEKYSNLKAIDKDSYELVKAAAKDTATVRITVENARVEKKKPYLEAERKIDAEAKRIQILLEKIETPLKAEKEAYETEIERQKQEKALIETNRINSIKQRLLEINNYALLTHGRKSDAIKKILEEFEVFKIKDFDFMEFKAEADGLFKQTKAAIENNLLNAEELEAEEAKVELQRIVNEQNKKKLDEEKAAFETQQKVEMQKIQAERDLLQAEVNRIKAKENEEKAKAEEEEKQKQLKAEKERLQQIALVEEARKAAHAAEDRIRNAGIELLAALKVCIKYIPQDAAEYQYVVNLIKKTEGV